ncbi:hypothetical protein RHSIM_Rhsim11G0007500 [Rhododendron simsii]|uniref:Uncharacterized protein n=1 Tax=Rhododendron simsii TaxID=118357 RepID=A0A834LC18_RHOSS|nr:hypothetical protein RHSIM_Rhsim11G0007500 [Rhododendron simsii]
MVCRLSTLMETQPTIYMLSRATPCYLNSNSFLENNKSTSSSLYFYLSLDKMCLHATEWITPPKPLFSRTRKQEWKRSNVRIHRLNSKRERKSEEKVGKDMELENLKLYKENMSIREENKLRKKATLLHQENLALMSELIRKKFSL